MLKVQLQLNDSFDFYKDICSKDPLIKRHIKKRERNVLLNLYTRFLQERLLEGEAITLPAKLGRLFIAGRREEVTAENMKRLSINWQASKKAKRAIYNLNEHTDGVTYGVKWSKVNSPVPNKDLVEAKLNRRTKHNLRDKIRENKVEYIINE